MEVGCFGIIKSDWSFMKGGSREAVHSLERGLQIFQSFTIKVMWQLWWCQGDVAKKIFDWCLGLWVFALVLGYILRFEEVAIRNNKLLCNVGFWTPTSIRSEAATQIIMIQHCNMIQHHSVCLYFSTDKLDPWHFLHTTNLPESVFTRELTGSLDDLTSGGSNKNGSSQNKGETGSR